MKDNGFARNKPSIMRVGLASTIPLLLLRYIPSLYPRLNWSITSFDKLSDLKSVFSRWNQIDPARTRAIPFGCRNRMKSSWPFRRPSKSYRGMLEYWRRKWRAPAPPIVISFFWKNTNVLRPPSTRFWTGSKRNIKCLQLQNRSVRPFPSPEGVFLQSDTTAPKAILMFNYYFKIIIFIIYYYYIY